MTRLQKIKEFIEGIVILAMAILLATDPVDGYPIVLILLGFTLIFYGIRYLVYFFTMARFMVGGRLSLYRALILINFGYLAETLTDVPTAYVLLYLTVIYAFSGLVDVLRASEARKYGAPSWKLKFFYGIFNLFLAAACIVFIKRTNIAVYIYCFGLFNSAIVKIITSFRKTTFIYIQ